MIFYSLLFCILAINLSLGEEDNVHCDTYKTLGSIPNPFSNRGSVCCDQIGCFSNEKTTVWSRISELPECMDKIRPEFYIYTSKSEYQNVDFFNLNESVKNLHLKPDKNFVVIVHGWNTMWPDNWMFPMKDAFVDANANVMLVRWSEGSNMTNYIHVAANVRSVSSALTLVLKNMILLKKINLDSTTLVGFSLGAHLVGLVGKSLSGLKEIIALDPAGPLFACEDQTSRLSESDAKYVQVFHTNGETVLKFGHGTMQPMGHVDYFINGGEIQNDCDLGVPTEILDVLKLNLSAIWKSMSCSHHRAHDLLTEMVKQPQSKTGCKFITFPCISSDSWLNGECFHKSPHGYPEPGYYPDRKIPSVFSGKYYFNVRPVTNQTIDEFCGVQYLITLTPEIEVKGSIDITAESILGETVTYQIQGKRSILSKKTPNGRIMILPKHFIALKNLTMSYGKYTSRLWSDGESSFQLLNATLTNSDGITWISCTAIKIDSGGDRVPLQFYNHCEQH